MVIAMIIAAKNFMSGLGLGAGAEIAAITEVTHASPRACS